MRKTLVAVMLVLSATFSPTPAAGQISEPGAPGTWPVGLSISGGISLGAYQAGVNWSLLEAFRRAATDSVAFAEFGVPRYRLAVVSGASAGNINTLLWAVEACTRNADPLPPQSSLFWQVWTGMGLNNMLPRKNEGDLSLLDRQALDSVIVKVARRLTDARLYDHCAVPAAITLTRVLPDTLRLVSDSSTKKVPAPSWRKGVTKPDTLEVLTQRFATTFVFSVTRNSGEFYAPWKNNADKHIPYGKVIQLPTVPNSTLIPNADVFAAVKASSAFPLAFQPVRLSYYFAGDLQRIKHNDVFIDGGVFDNNPVGLALEYYFESEKKLRLNTPELDLLYVNPGRIREPFKTAIKNDNNDSIPPGGLGTLLAFAGGAISTARQYELQIVARDTSLYSRIPFRLGFTNRGAPIFGEHLGAFAAFIAFPMREYDFAVGVYDGLHFIAQQYGCRVTPEPCTARKLKDLLLSNAINLGPVGGSVAELLYNKEFGRPLTDSIGKLWPLTGRDSLKAALFTAFHSELVPHDPEKDEYCEGLSLAALTLCKDGLRDVIRDLNTPEVVRLLEQLYGDGRCVHGAGDCDNSLLIMLQDVDRNSDLMLDRFVARIGDVERRVAPGTTSTEAKLASAAYWMFRASSGAHPRQDLDPSTIPDSRTVFHVLPFYVGQNLGTSGFELRWRPTWNPTRSIGVTVPILTQWNWNVRRPDRRYDFYAGTGVGLVFRGLPKISELGVSGHIWRPTYDADKSLFAEVEANIRLLQLVQVGVRHTVGPQGDGRMHGKSKVGLSLGLTDVNGMLYWLRYLR